MRVDEVFRRLEEHYDVDGWWPWSDPWEVMVGALLTQQTNWNNVVRSLGTLRELSLDDPGSIASAETRLLEEAVRPCGFFRQKSRRLKALAATVRDRYGGDPMLLLSEDDAREHLLEMEGVGPETADSILVFAAGRPFFVAAAYSERVLGRTGAVTGKGYHEVQEEVHRALGRETATLARFYALLVEHSKRYCRPHPTCNGCPLASDCRFRK